MSTIVICTNVEQAPGLQSRTHDSIYDSLAPLDGLSASVHLNVLFPLPRTAIH
jgi:hypothetical protein